MKKFFPLAALAVAMVTAPAFAATTITQTISFSNKTTDFSQNGTFSLFDSSLGQLTAVNISDSYGFTTTITLTNTGANTISGRASTYSELGISAANTAQNQAIQNLFSTAGTAGTDTYTDSQGNTQNFDYDSSNQSGNQNFTVNGGSTKTLATATAATVDSGTLSTSLAADLAAFTASASNGTSGTINLKTLTGTTLSVGGGNVTASQATNASGGFSIFYSYIAAAAVPEPSTWTMMIAGFGLVGLGMRRKGTAVLFN